MSLANAIRNGEVRITLRVGAAVEPITRAKEHYKTARDWVDSMIQKDIDRWAVIDSLAAYFHPGKTARGARGAMLYLGAERGDKFNIDLVKGLAPTLYKKLPTKARGTPVEYLSMIMWLAACLVCHEGANLAEVLKEKSVDDRKVFEHLYWLERFYRLYERIKAAPPPNLGILNKKRGKAGEWQSALRLFFDGYMRRHPKAKMRTVVTNFCNGRKEANGPSMDRAYRWALGNLK